MNLKQKQESLDWDISAVPNDGIKLEITYTMFSFPTLPVLRVSFILLFCMQLLCSGFSFKPTSSSSILIINPV